MIGVGVDAGWGGVTVRVGVFEACAARLEGVVRTGWMMNLETVMSKSKLKRPMGFCSMSIV